MTLQLRVGEATASGPREENQDALRCVLPAGTLAASKGHLFALADGVSQCADGRLAAHSTVQALALDYFSTPETWTVAQSLERLLGAQNRWLMSAAGGQPLLTTLSALILRGSRFTLAHVGDCRVYRCNAAGLVRLSQDHVWQQPGMEHVLTRALGLEGHLVVDFSEDRLQVGDRFLLASDGVWGALAESVIRDILQLHTDPAMAARLLVDTAHRAGSRDNASAIVIDVDALPQADWSEHAPTLPIPPSLKKGQWFEGWQVLELLGESRQSRRYRVCDEQQRHWLLKTLPGALRDDTAAAQGLLMEEWFLRRVSGRSFVEVHPAPNRRYLYYLQREYAGQTLAEQLQAQGPLALADWLDCASRLLRAVGQLHRRNLLHRDIKPQNLHRGTDGELRLLDFGLVFCPGLSRDTSSAMVGTASFIAPELYNGASPQPRQDLFAVGVTLFYALTGQYPYGEVEAFQTPRHGVPASVVRRRPDVPDWLEGWLGRCIDIDPQQRFETAEEALLELERGESGPMARPRPLLHRNPLKTWRCIALLAVLMNLLLLLVLLYRP